MAGRIVHFVVAGAAIVTGMMVQGDINVGQNAEREVHRGSDRVVDRRSEQIQVRTGQTQGEVDSETKRALAAAVAELVRAEGSLIAAKLDDKVSAEAIEHVEHRRDVARDTVERVADEARAQSRGNREAIREIREEVRDALRN